MGPEYEEGKRYLITFTGRNWRLSDRYNNPQPAVFREDYGDPKFYFESEDFSNVGVEEYEGHEYEVTPIDESTPTELHYLYPDGIEFSVFPNRDGEIVFVQETFDSLVSRLGAKPAPKKYEDGLYVDKDGDTVYVAPNQWVYNDDGWTVESYASLYGPLIRKDDQ